jgi:hypothetical protein
MSDHADRVIADNAIEIIANGIKAAFSNCKQLSTKRGGLTVPNPDSSKSKNKSA